MTLRGVGIDVVETTRFRALSVPSRKRFIERTFTTQERRYCEDRTDSLVRFAGTLAAKEAVFKALGKGHVLDFEVRRTKSGTPQVWRKGKRISRILVSIDRKSTRLNSSH